MSKKTVHSKLTMVIALWILLLAAACSKPEEKEPEPVVPVQMAQVERATIRHVIHAQAILYPLEQASIVPKISAPVRSFEVQRGDHVKRGQLLAVLENRDLAAAALEAKGQSDQVEANFRSTVSASLPEEVMKAQSDVRSLAQALEAAQKAYDSRKTLLDQGALPRKQLDEANVTLAQARSQYEVAQHHLESLEKVNREELRKAAQAQVDAAKGHLESANAQLDYSRITSPIDGVITDRPLYPGEMAATGSPLLTVMNISRMIARANVPVNELPHIKVGDSATVTALNEPVQLSGTVTVVSPALEPNSTTAEVWVTAPNRGERYRPGMSVDVMIVAATIPDALVVPESAILPSQGRADTVLVVGSDSMAHERKIETGVRDDGRVQVLKGLAPGEQVITVGGFGLQDKTKVRIGNEPDAKSDAKEPKP